MNFHELKDIVTIYSQTPDGKFDNTWDKAEIKVWTPDEQCEMALYFTGSSKGKTPEEHLINFNVQYKDENHNDVFIALVNTIKKFNQDISEEDIKKYKIAFINELLNIQH